jgi:hypothetical protein
MSAKNVGVAVLSSVTPGLMKAVILSPVLRGRRRIATGSLDAAQHAIEHQNEQVLLALGDLVHRPARAAQRRGQLGDGDAPEAVAQEDLFDALQQSVTAVCGGAALLFA